MKFNDNKKGMALMWVVFVMVVISVIVASLLALSLGDTRNAAHQEQKLQAQYIARAGANATAKYVLDNPQEFNPNTFTSKNIPSTNLGEGSFNATVTRPFKGGIVVTSIGEVAGFSETVSLSLSRGSYNSLFKGIRQTGAAPLDLQAMPISYESGSSVEIEANVTSLSQITLTGSNMSDPNISRSVNNESLSEPVLPSGYASYPYKANQSGEHTIIGNARFGTLSIGNKQRLTFNTEGQAEMNVVVDSLQIKGPSEEGGIHISGAGVVHLFIRGDSSIDTPVSVNTGNASQLFIYVFSGAKLELQANCNLKGYIYAPNAIVQIQSNQTRVEGAIIGNILQKNGAGNGAHGNFHFVPLPDDTAYDGIQFYTKSHFSN